MGKISRKSVVLRRILRAQARRGLLLARLPIEDKIDILITMQRTFNQVRISAGRKPLPEWRV